MPLDGNGGYDPPSPENPVRAGTLIKSEDFNTTIDDISDALSTAIYRDGQAPMEADLRLNYNNLTQVASIVSDDDILLHTDKDLTISADNTEITIEGESTITLGGNRVFTVAGSGLHSFQGDFNLSAAAAVLTIPTITATNSDLSVNSITLQDGTQITKHTSVGGLDRPHQSVITNELGLLDLSLMPFSPTPTDLSVLAIASEDLQAGSFVYINSANQAVPANNNNQAVVSGFVLESYSAGNYAIVHLAGMNNLIEPVGEVFNEDYTAYLSLENPRQVSHSPTGGQIVGIFINTNTIYFRTTQSDGSNLLCKFYSYPYNY